MTPFAVIALGFFLGMRHATDADHVIAVSTIVTRERSVRAAMLVGALWGIGHTATIVAVGGAIVLFGLVIPPRVGLSLEFSVAMMLIVLGAMNLTGVMKKIDEAARAMRTSVVPEADPAQQTWQAYVELCFLRRFRPLMVGVVHGLAGSAAVALLVLTTIRDADYAVFYLAIFGVGTVAGMMLLTTAMAVPIAVASRKLASFDVRLAQATGLASIAFGLFLVYRIGFVDGLFLGHPNWTPR